jgi:hypothetical protein
MIGIVSVWNQKKKPDYWVVFLLNNIKAADRGVYAAAAAVDLGIYTTAAEAVSGDDTSSNACVMARYPLLPLNYALSYPDILL